MIGKTISHYKILEKLGCGGIGVVNKAQDTKLDRFVTLKFLPQDLTSDDEAKERFVHEDKAASKLQHNNIYAIHEIDETDDGRIFICMDYYIKWCIAVSGDTVPIRDKSTYMNGDIYTHPPYAQCIDNSSFS